MAISKQADPKFFTRLFRFVAGVAGMLILVALILVAPALVALEALRG